MPDKLIPSSSSNTIGILPMRHMTREKRRTVNVTWLCCAVALILIVLIGFAFLLKNFFGGHWPNVPNPFLPSSSKGSLDQDIPPVSPFRPNVNLYDTAIPQENPPIDRQRSFEQEIITKPSTIEQRKRDQLFSENERVQVNIVRRAQWGAHAAKKKFFFESFAIDKAIVMETGGESCFNSDHCGQIIRNLQKTDLKTYNLNDIRYNFLIGGDGTIFEGRGFNEIGQHTLNHNNASLGIALIGKFDKEEPPEAQVLQLRRLLQYGIAWEHLKSNYELFGHDQLLPDGQVGGDQKTNAAANPGVKLFEIIRKWPHWTENNFYKTYH